MGVGIITANRELANR